MKLILLLLFYVFISIGGSSVDTPALADGTAQSSAATMVSIEAADKYVDKKLSSDWGWTNEPWTGNDEAFAKTRAKIDVEFKGTSDPLAAAEAYQNAAVDNPHNALEQFRWAYACYCAAHSKSAREPGVAPIILLYCLLQATQPHCYDYNRLIFLYMNNDPRERGLAERLLKKDPNDISVKIGYAELLALCQGDANKAKALKIAQDMVDAKQDMPVCYFLLGYVYDTTATKDNQVDHYPKAIAALNQYIALERKDAPGRAAALQAVGSIKRRLQNAQ